MADTTSIVPTISPQEALRAAAALAARGKARFLEGAVEEATDLVQHAAKLCSTLDAEASGLLMSLAKSFAAYIGGNGPPTAKPAAPAPRVPAPAPPAVIAEPAAT